MGAREQNKESLMALKNLIESLFGRANLMNLYMKREYRINRGYKAIYFVISGEIIGLTIVYLIPSTFYYIISLFFIIGYISLMTSIIFYLKIWLLKK